MRCTLCGASIGLLAWCSAALPQRPSDREIGALIEKSRQKAVEYTQSLPDFLATEVIHRYIGGERVNGFWPTDTLTIQVRYFQHKEDHQLVLINGKPTSRSFETLEGTIGCGEFGATLSAVFDPDSQTSFRWQSWKNVRKRRVSVIDYAVNGPYSHYHLEAGANGHTVEADAGYHGVLEIDAETGEVFRLEYVADHIPKDLHLQYAGVTVDYAPAEVGGQYYLLPSRSEMKMHTQGRWTRNVTEFREYRKFTAESSIGFDTDK